LDQVLVPHRFVIEVVFRNRQSIRFRAIDEKNDRFLFRNRCLVFLGSSEHVIVRGGVDVRVFRVRGVLLFSSVVFKIVEHLVVGGGVTFLLLFRLSLSSQPASQPPQNTRKDGKKADTLEIMDDGARLGLR